MSDEPNPNLPTPRQAAIMRPPSARHRAERIDRNTHPHGDVNTVAMPWVDFNEDVQAIREGRAFRDGNRFVVNGREYVLEGNGRLFPTTGAGLYRIGRGAYRALGRYNEGGLVAAVEAQLDEMHIREDERRVARTLWRAIRDWKQEQG
ncbi:MAG: hypothetical protein U0893_27335 [Chloroflexota bacterium]